MRVSGAVIGVGIWFATVAMPARVWFAATGFAARVSPRFGRDFWRGLRRGCRPRRRIQFLENQLHRDAQIFLDFRQLPQRRLAAVAAIGRRRIGATDGHNVIESLAHHGRASRQRSLTVVQKPLREAAAPVGHGRGFGRRAGVVVRQQEVELEVIGAQVAGRQGLQAGD